MYNLITGIDLSEWPALTGRQYNRRKDMEKYICDVCGYVYDPAAGDPDNGVEPGTAWEDVPEDWVCPLCGVGKDNFEAE